MPHPTGTPTRASSASSSTSTGMGVSSVGRDHRGAARVDGVDDLGIVDSLQVDRRDPEVGVPELALDDVQWHALAPHLDGVGVTQLVRREAAPDGGLRGGAPQLLAHARRRQRSPTGAPVNHAEERADDVGLGRTHHLFGHDSSGIRRTDVLVRHHRFDRRPPRGGVARLDASSRSAGAATPAFTDQGWLSSDRSALSSAPQARRIRDISTRHRKVLPASDQPSSRPPSPGPPR